MALTPLNAKYAKCKKPKLVWDRYQMGGTALQITDNGEDIATASVYVGPVPAGYIAIKDYSENEGILAWLIENEIVLQPKQYIPSGYVMIPICKILVHYPGELVEITNNACGKPVHACWAKVTKVDRFVHTLNEHNNVVRFHLDGRPVGGGDYHMRKV